VGKAQRAPLQLGVINSGFLQDPGLRQHKNSTVVWLANDATLERGRAAPSPPSQPANLLRLVSDSVLSVGGYGATEQLPPPRGGIPES